MDIKKQFCIRCGKELIEEWRGTYIKETGEKSYRLICPEFPCEHSQDLYEGHIFKVIREGWFSQTDQCQRCGKTRRWGGYEF